MEVWRPSSVWHVNQLTSQFVSVTAKVTEVEEPMKTTTEDRKILTKQDVYIADTTGSTPVVLWCITVGR